MQETLFKIFSYEIILLQSLWAAAILHHPQYEHNVNILWQGRGLESKMVTACHRMELSGSGPPYSPRCCHHLWACLGQAVIGGGSKKVWPKKVLGKWHYEIWQIYAWWALGRTCWGPNEVWCQIRHVSFTHSHLGRYDSAFIYTCECYITPLCSLLTGEMPPYLPLDVSGYYYYYYYYYYNDYYYFAFILILLETHALGCKLWKLPYSNSVLALCKSYFVDLFFSIMILLLYSSFLHV